MKMTIPKRPSSVRGGRWRDRTCITAAMVLGLCASFASPAAAVSFPSGSAGYGPVNGFSYDNRSVLVLIDSDNKKWAEVNVDKVGGAGTVPAGWMGAGVTIYRNGVACTNAVMTYNAVAMNNR